jgi:pimeloyl-ACP methyl ester carboxylesterase
LRVIMASGFRVLGFVSMLVTAGCTSAPPSADSPVAATTVAAAPTTASTTVPSADLSEASPKWEASSSEVRFRSGDFDLVGTLHLPAGPGPFGALILVHGSGPQTRESTPSSGLIRRRFVEAGYAVLSWDKPGSGESTGEFDHEYGKTQRATILADAIEVVAQHPAVDSDRIGLWGLSEAGWVMPIALDMTDDIAFMIVVSGGGEDSIEQQVYQWIQQARCSGATDEELASMERHGAAALKATTYSEYRDAMEPLLAIPDINQYVGVTLELAGEDEWVPWPRDIDAFFDPIEVIARTTIPVLAIFGEHDTAVDPIQGSEAYQAALERAGNKTFHVEVIPNVGHTLTPSKADGCITGGGSYAPRYLELIDEWINLHQAP